MTGSERFLAPERKGEGGITIEIGTGSWPLPFQLTKVNRDQLLSRTSRYINVDINELALKQSPALRDKSSVFDFLVARADALPFADGSVHRIIMTNFLGIPPLGKFDRDYYHAHLLEECHRVLGEGGEVIIVEVYTPHYARDWLKRHQRSVDALFSRSNEAPVDSVFKFQDRRPAYSGSETDPFVLVLTRKKGVALRT